MGIKLGGRAHIKNLLQDGFLVCFYCHFKEGALQIQKMTINQDGSHPMPTSIHGLGIYLRALGEFFSLNLQNSWVKI